MGFFPMPPCGPGKDCTEVEHDGAITLLPRTGPQLAPLPLPQERTPANTVPEPGTLALIGAGLAGLMLRAAAMAAAMILLVLAGELLGMDVRDG